MPRPKNSPPCPSRGFSLVLSLTVMAMLLLLCIGAAALLTVELRVSRATASYAKARLNAMAGARIALGEIQRRLGPDQRISATADILCEPADGSTPKDIDFYKSSPNNTAPGVTGTVVHPRWTGVWNSGRVSDGAIATTPVDGDETKVIQRDAQNGYLQDARFANGNDWAKSRADHTKTKRFGGWLVSGNEATTLDFEKTPFTPIASTDELIVGPGILGKLFNMSEKLSDMMGVRVPSVTLPSSTSEPIGRYAYWVSDEGVKARVNLTDPYEVAGKAPDGNGGAGYFRLMVPQRNNLSIVNEPADFQYQSDPAKVQNTPSGRWTNYAAKAKSGKWANCTSFADLTVVDAAVQDIGAAAEKTVAANYLHDLTFDSSSVLADVVNGGLRRDLTPFLDSGDISAVGSTTAEIIQPTKLTATTPILNDAGLSIFDKNGPLLAHLRSWNNVAPQTFTAAINPQTPSGYFQPTNAVFPLPDYNTQGAASAVAVTPVLAAMDMYYTAAYDPADASTPAAKFKFLFYPRIVLWNPYDVPINISGMELYWARQLFAGGINDQVAINRINHKIDYKFNVRNSPFYFTFPSMTLNPGESVCFRNGEPGKKLQAGTKIQLAVGSLTNPAQCYVWAPSLTQPALTPEKEQEILNGTCTHNLGNAYNYIGYPSAGPYAHTYLMQSGKVIQQIDSEEFSYTSLGAIYNTPNQSFRTLDEEKGRFPHATSALKYRLVWIDENPSRDDNIDTSGSRWGWNSAWRKNVEMNPMLGFNLRGTRLTRFPTDMMRQMSDDFRPYSGFFTNDCVSTVTVTDSRYQAQGSGAYTAPLFRNNKGNSANTRYTLYSVPRKETGLLSLAALQNAPLIPFAWSTSMPIGNSYPDVAVPTDRSALGKVAETVAWSFSCPGGGQFTRGVAPATRIGSNLTQVDWSYELNNALWDGYFFSGIEKSNDGWSGNSWETDYTSTGKRLRNARLQQVREADDNSTNNAIRAASTCLLKGGFNVNSTSVAAWASLLSAFRDIPVETKSNGVQKSAGVTPYLRNLWPDKGPLTVTQNATFDEKTWSGYRVLSDDEITKLASSIVKEVRTRGPFLSLADFVNRRLKPNPNDVYNPTPEFRPSPRLSSYFASPDIVKKWEADYHGTIQAAIDNAGINDRFDQNGLSDDYFVNMARCYRYAGKQSYGLIMEPPVKKYMSVVPRVEHLPRHKAAGAPAYLTQADVLQQIGSVLSARSDTFKIRCKGVSDEGAEAIVELIVQRTPEALVPRRDNGMRLAHVPEGVTTGPLVGTQHFGRRFVVSSFRYVGENEI